MVVGVAVLAMGAVGAGCARSCPSGTTLKGGKGTPERAEYCARDDDPVDSLPVTGRTVESAITLMSPTSVGGRSVQGPYRSWNPDGSRAAHGQYVVSSGGTSVPHGRWTFWREDGRPHMQGELQNGEPTGCFLVWTEDGRRVTMTARNGRLEPASCHATWVAPRWPLDSRTSLEVSAQYEVIALTPVSAEFQNTRILERTAVHGPAAIVKLPIGRLGLGAVASLQFSGDGERRELAGFAAMIRSSVSVLHGHDTLDLELALDAGVRDARTPFVPLSERLRVNSTSFLLPRAAVGLDLGWRLTRGATLYLGGSAGWERSIETRLENVAECFGTSFGPACPAREADWRVGGWFGGLRIGARFEL